VNPLKRPAWMDEGDDPDYRYSLANERTFLAWIRTSLALLAGAVAVVQLVPPFRVHGARPILGAILAVTGLALSVLAYTRWAANERAMRAGRPLAFSPMLRIVAGALGAVGVGVLVLAVIAGK
jgi:putative membrane protein